MPPASVRRIAMEMIECPFCENDIPATSIICDHCGTRTGVSAESLQKDTAGNGRRSPWDDYIYKKRTDGGIRIIKYIGGGGDVMLPGGVTEIGDNAFRDCTSVKSVTLPDSVREICFSAFWNCTHMRSVKLPQSIVHIRDSAFGGCSSLTNMIIPPKVTCITDFAFGGCTSLRMVKLPDGIEEIGSLSFNVLKR